MPRRGLLPELSPLAHALSKRAVYGPTPGRLDQVGAVRPLLEILPPTDANASGDDYKQALAFEELLEAVVAQLDDTFLYRREDESPTLIARGLFSLDSGWPRTLKERRGKICKMYKWSADDFRQRYARTLYEHIAAQLESQAASDSPKRLTEPSSGSTTPLTFDEWAHNVTSGVEDFYDLLDRGMHSPPMHSEEPLVRATHILYSYARLRDIYHRDRPSVGNYSSLASSIDEAMQEVERRIPFDLRDRRRLSQEAHRSTSRDRSPEVFEDFLEEANQGVRILSSWNSWLNRCECRLHPGRPPGESAAFCDVHLILSRLERFLSDIRDGFTPGWQRRDGNEVLVEFWEQESKGWR